MHDSRVTGAGTGPPPVDPAQAQRIAEAQAQLFPKLRSDDPRLAETLERALLLHVWQGNGIYEVRQNRVMRITRRIAEVTPATPGLPVVFSREGLELRVPKMRSEHLKQVVAFFRAVYGVRQSEALIDVWYDPGTDRHILNVPPQEVTPAHVEHHGPAPELDCADEIVRSRLLHVMQIHSHANMGAFWSGTDDGDERKHPLRLFGVIGKIPQSVPEWRWRVWSGSAFIDLTLEDLFDLSDPWTLSVTLADVLRGTVAIAATDPLRTDIPLPDTWLSRVRPPTPVTADRDALGRFTRSPRLFGYDSDDEGTWYGGYMGYGNRGYSHYPGYGDTREPAETPPSAPPATEAPESYPPRPQWALEEGVTEQQWRDWCKRHDYRGSSNRDRSTKQLSRREKRRVRRAADAAMKHDPPDRPSALDSKPAGALIFRGGQWWKKLGDGTWVLDEWSKPKGGKS